MSIGEREIVHISRYNLALTSARRDFVTVPGEFPM